MATADAIAKLIDSLKETEEQPRKQITEIVEVLGDEVSLGLLAETLKIQEEGGLVVRDGSRQRTLGGVFFNLAKAKLPKADRNRIFRVRVPKPAVEGEAQAEQAPASSKSAPKPRVEAAPAEDRREAVGFSSEARGGSPSGSAGAGALGRRRVVEVEVLRHPGKPAPVVPVPEPRPVPPPVRLSEPRAPAPEVRPLRRIVTVAAPPKEAPPETPEAARDRVKDLLKALSPDDQRRVLTELLKDAGGLPEPKPAPPPRKTVEPPPPKAERGIADETRERVLAAVTETLGLSAGDLARVLYGEETSSAKVRARAALERWRKSEG
jgi:hypothetical protein